MKNKTRIILIHIVFSLAFLSIPILSGPPGSVNLLDELKDAHLWKDFFGYSLTLVFFYTCYYKLIPEYFFTGKYFIFILFCLLGFAVITALPNLLNIAPDDMHGPHNGRGPGVGGAFRNKTPLMAIVGHMTHNFLRFVVVVFVSLALKINSRLKETQREKLNTEISFLKAQINPHFLFNTLNSIYSLTLTKSDDAPKAVVKLSGIMRYAISEADHELVPLEKEIAYISNYIELQKLRLTSKVKITYTITGNAGGRHIAPFLLIPFVENAFKYGVNSEEDSNIQIGIDASDAGVNLHVHNNKVYVNRENTFATGLGIHNTKLRLEMLYSGKHHLILNDDADDFTVSLQINLV